MTASQFTSRKLPNRLGSKPVNFLDKTFVCSKYSQKVADPFHNVHWKHKASVLKMSSAMKTPRQSILPLSPNKAVFTGFSFDEYWIGWFTYNWDVCSWFNFPQIFRVTVSSSLQGVMKSKFLIWFFKFRLYYFINDTVGNVCPCTMYITLGTFHSIIVPWRCGSGLPDYLHICPSTLWLSSEYSISAAL